MKLTWRKCPCESELCVREYPVEIGTFYTGSGFDPDDKVLVERAFDALGEEGNSRGFDLAKTMMIRCLEAQIAGGESKRDNYILGPLSDEQLDLVKNFVTSFYE